jgi:formylglycine-generating enzyme required for sulfatase activity
LNGKNDVRWFGIEMAYVPKADSVYIGDGSSNNSFGQKDGKPILLKSSSTLFSLGDSLGEVSKPEPFYLMKYEISQRQYVDFLNTLTAFQQQKRIDNTVYSNAGVSSFANAAQNRNGIELEVPFVNYEPAVFITEKPYVACNGLNAADILAYLCWAGLRPMTEIEFEYAARGSAKSQAKEGAWGNSNCEDVNALLDSNMISERYINHSEDSTTGKANYGLPVGTYYLQGPGRSGALFTSNSNRINAGAGYFGHADLSGNVWELCISVPYVNMSIGLGTGNIEDLENGTLVWPNTENGYIYRGGGWNSIVLNRLSYSFRDIAISDRFYAGSDVNIRRNTTGGRGAL